MILNPKLELEPEL